MLVEHFTGTATTMRTCTEKLVEHFTGTSTAMRTRREKPSRKLQIDPWMKIVNWSLNLQTPRFTYEPVIGFILGWNFSKKRIKHEKSYFLKTMKKKVWESSIFKNYGKKKVEKKNLRKFFFKNYGKKDLRKFTF